MDCVDAVVKLGYVDSSKLGVTGGSGGGLLTDWTVTQTDAVQGGGVAEGYRGLVELVVHRRTSTLFQPTWFEGTPFR